MITHILGKNDMESYLNNLRVRLKLVNLEQSTKRAKDSFSPKFIAHGTHVSPEEFIKISGQNATLPAFRKATQNELETIKNFLSERPEFVNMLKEKRIDLEQSLGIPERVFGIPTKAENTENAAPGQNGLPEPQAGSFAYALKKCSASIHFVDNEIPLLVGFEEKYKQFEEGKLKGHIYILDGKGFEANYNKDGIVTEYTLPRDARIVHHMDITPEKAMQAGAQFVMFKTKEEYEAWANKNTFQDSFKTGSNYMQSLINEVESGNAVYINATSRGLSPRLSALTNAQNGNVKNADIKRSTREL